MHGHGYPMYVRGGRRWVGAKCAAVLALALLGVSPPQSVEAEIPPIIRPSTRPWFLQFEMGPAIKLATLPTQFKLVQAFGYHFWGGGEGPAVGASLQESFSDVGAVIQMGPRFWWDFQPVKNLGLYLAPVAQLGYGVATGSGDSSHFFDLQFGFEPRLVLDNRGYVFFRFVTIDVAIGEEVGARYDLMFGGGVTL